MAGDTKQTQERVRQAINGDHGEDQQRIAEEGMQLVALLLCKNTDYGGSAWQIPTLAPELTPREAIQCRMSDKIQRLQRLLAGQQTEVSESTEDTMRDLAGYCVLWLGVPQAVPEVITDVVDGIRVEETVDR
jgi:hypothetical protein